jgi:hypothetical protein
MAAVGVSMLNFIPRRSNGLLAILSTPVKPREPLRQQGLTIIVELDLDDLEVAVSEG